MGRPGWHPKPSNHYKHFVIRLRVIHLFFKVYSAAAGRCVGRSFLLAENVYLLHTHHFLIHLSFTRMLISLRRHCPSSVAFYLVHRIFPRRVICRSHSSEMGKCSIGKSHSVFDGCFLGAIFCIINYNTTQMFENFSIIQEKNMQ